MHTQIWADVTLVTSTRIRSPAEMVFPVLHPVNVVSVAVWALLIVGGALATMDAYPVGNVAVFCRSRTMDPLWSMSVVTPTMVQAKSNLSHALFVPVVIVDPCPLIVNRTSSVSASSVVAVAALSTSGAPVPAVARPSREVVAMFAIFANWRWWPRTIRYPIRLRRR